MKTLKTLAELEAERRAFIESLKPQMVEILDAAVIDGHPIDYQELRADVTAELTEDRAAHRRRKFQTA